MVEPDARRCDGVASLGLPPVVEDRNLVEKRPVRIATMAD